MISRRRQPHSNPCLILFHDRRHPRELGACHVAAFLSDLATKHRPSASTQNQALAAILFLYAEVLRIDLDPVETPTSAGGPKRLPGVLTRGEISRLLSNHHGTPRLMASLLDGAGLRLLESVSIRVKDIDFERQQLSIRRAKTGSRRRRTRHPPLESCAGARLARDGTLRESWHGRVRHSEASF